MLDGDFRSDLLYRIDVLDLDIPPLRKRKDDILLIFNSFLKRYMDDLKLSVDITNEALNILKSYSWPGNIRELENICQRFTLLLSENPKLSQKSIKKLLSNCIGEEKFLNDILKSYNFSKSNESGKVYSAEMINTIKNCLSYNNEYIAEKLGTSRTSLWRNLKSNE